jgi:hypothetical protein
VFKICSLPTYFRLNEDIELNYRWFRVGPVVQSQGLSISSADRRQKTEIAGPFFAFDSSSSKNLRTTIHVANSMATTLSSFEALPHQIMTTVLEYLPLGNVYLLERTSKSLRAAVEFNPYLKYKTADGERSINPLQSCGAYAVHHAWKYIKYW